MITVADLFCGAGGASAGLHAAAVALGLTVQLTAVNHWDKAIATHSSNFPDAVHLLTDIAEIEPKAAVPGGVLHLLLAGPSCVHFSQARGGRPTSDQQRSGAWQVVKWCEELHVCNVLVENVPEFQTWGPVDETTGKPIKEQSGLYFRQWKQALEALGYRVEHRVLCSADFGDATTRRRLFVQARKGNRPITWAKPTHLPAKDVAAIPGAKPWVPARQIINWGLPSESIFARKKPLAPKTMGRILAGLRKFCGLSFTIGQQSGATPRSTDDPIATVATAGAISLVEPFLVQFTQTGKEGKGGIRRVSDPIPTLTTKTEHGVCEPFLVVLRGTSERQVNNTAQSTEEPLPTVCANAGHLALCQPFIVPNFSSQDAKSVEAPLNTITTNSRGVGLCEPFLVRYNGEERTQAVDMPLTTIDTANRFGLCEPFLVPVGGPTGSQRERSINEPFGTLLSQNHLGVCEPFIVSYYGSSEGAQSTEEPLDTVTTRDRFGLVMPTLAAEGEVLAYLDIRFRMLTPEELAAAHSFDPDYKFSGNKSERVKQVGNSWTVKLSTALCTEILRSEVAA